jgi:hypothetical protein
MRKRKSDARSGGDLDTPDIGAEQVIDRAIFVSSEHDSEREPGN